MGSGVKQNETRSWPTSYRGELVICSAKRKPSREEVGDGETYDVAMRMPYGCAICVVEIYDCRGVEWVSSQPNFTEAERDLGDYTPGMGRYAWMTRNCRTLTTPLPIVGRQGLWILTPETIAAIKALLPNTTNRAQKIANQELAQERGEESDAATETANRGRAV
jgi:hypothetical protein